MKADILKQTPMAGAENKPITIRPFRIHGIVSKHVSVKEVADSRHSQRHPRVARFRVLNGIHDQHPQIVGAAAVDQFLEFFVAVVYGGGGELRRVGVLELMLP